MKHIFELPILAVILALACPPVASAQQSNSATFDGHAVEDIDQLQDLFENDDAATQHGLSQLSFGFQWGGQAYSEFLFFEDAAALADFKRGNYELGAQASAVAVTAGVSADAEFNGGMAIFTQAKGGLMYEASVGGQKFKVEPKE